MNGTNIQRLADASVTIARKGALAYIEAKKLDVDAKTLAEALPRHIAAKLDEALSDARAALDCGMCDVAVTTFGASMLAAGIAAAKETSAPTAAELEVSR
jgi:hypothetical protein